MTLHSSLGNRVRPCLKKKKEKKKEERERKIRGRAQWLMPVIPELQEAEVGRLQSQEFDTNLTNMVKPCLY